MSFNWDFGSGFVGAAIVRALWDWYSWIKSDKRKRDEAAEEAWQAWQREVDRKIKWLDDSLFDDDGYLKRFNDRLGALEAKVFPPARRKDDARGVKK